jgi:hypothetical protein
MRWDVDRGRVSDGLGPGEPWVAALMGAGPWGFLRDAGHVAANGLRATLGRARWEGDSETEQPGGHRVDRQGTCDRDGHGCRISAPHGRRLLGLGCNPQRSCGWGALYMHAQRLWEGKDVPFMVDVQRTHVLCTAE